MNCIPSSLQKSKNLILITSLNCEQAASNKSQLSAEAPCLLASISSSRLVGSQVGKVSERPSKKWVEVLHLRSSLN